ncbi:unnamed protein product, partial [marine sediment metagenome]
GHMIGGEALKVAESIYTVTDLEIGTASKVVSIPVHKP